MSIRKGNNIIAGNPSIESVANVDLSNLSSNGKHYIAFKGYDSATAYSLNDVVVSIQNDEVKIYQSLADNNTSSLSDTTKWKDLTTKWKDLSDTTKWKEVSLGGGAGGEIGDMGFAPLGIDESLNLRRYLNGQVISQTQFVSFTTKVKSAVALFPSLATTESNWQAEKALSKFGQVGKFVIDDENQTIRLPAVVNVQGLLNLTGIGNLVNESLPNITGGITSDQSNIAYTGDTGTGALYTEEGPAFVSNSNSANRSRGIFIDASLSSPTYQNDAPVQQEAIQYPFYIQVATGVEEELPAIREYKINTPFFFGQSMYSENAPYNASWLASNGQYNSSTLYHDFWTQLTGVELNTSLNVGDTIEIGGKTYIKRGLSVKLSTDTYDDYDFVVNQNDQTFRLPLLNGSENLPSNRYEDLTLTSTTQRFTAPANGIYTVSGIGLTWVDLANETSGEFGSCSQPRTADNFGRYTIKAKQGDQIAVFCGAIPSSYLCRFVYDTGNGTLYYYIGDTVQDASLINAGRVLSDVAEVKRRQTVMSIPATSGAVMLTDNTIYSGTMTDTMTFVLPTITDATQYHQIKAMLYLPVVTIDWGTTHYIGSEAPDVSEEGQYMIYWDYIPNLNSWAVGAMKTGSESEGVV